MILFNNLGYLNQSSKVLFNYVKELTLLIEAIGSL